MKKQELFKEILSKYLKKYSEKTIFVPPGNLGIPRRNMPNIENFDLEDFISWIKSKKISVKRTKILGRSLKPIQKDINFEVVKEIMTKSKDKLKRPVLVSNDGYILDGHHRWLAAVNLDSEYMMECFKIDLNAKDFLKLAMQYPKIKYIDTDNIDYKKVDKKMKYSKEKIIEAVKKKLSGIYDPAIFKAIIMAGGPGSGKTSIIKKSLTGHGFIVLNSDQLTEKYLNESGLGLKFNEFSPEKMQEALELREKAKKKIDLKMKTLIEGKNGLIIDGTGKKIEKIKTQKEMLEENGYDVYLVFVNTSLEIAQERNKKRERSLTENEVNKQWIRVQSNLGAFQDLFKENLMIIDNNERNEDLELKLWKNVAKIAKMPVKNHKSKKFIEMMMKEKDLSNKK